MTDETLRELWANVLTLPGTMIEARDHAVVTIGPHTGHTLHTIAFCGTDEIAKVVAAALIKYQDAKVTP